jgi:NADH:ubiquinone oxidoreductase subunit C
VIDRITGSDAVNKVQSVVGDKGRDIKENFGQVDFICDPTNLVDVMTLLRDEAGLKFFTFLSAVDRTELDENKTAYGSGLEVLIHLYAPDHAMHVNVHVPVDLEDPRCPSLTDLFGGALWHERECHEMFEVATEVAASQGLSTQQMVLNVGPQHPATHGVFRLLATIDGEVLVEAEPIIGYMHRGYEKLVEARDYRQITNLISRMDWLSGICNELPMWMAIEQLMEVEVPPRAQYMRVIMV